MPIAPAASSIVGHTSRSSVTSSVLTELREEALRANERTVATRAAVADRLADAIDGGSTDISDGAGGEGGGRSAASRAAGAAQQAKSRVDEWRSAAMSRTLAPPRVPSDFLKQCASHLRTQP